MGGSGVIDRPLVSIAIPAYGRPGGLSRLLDSIDDWTNIEVVIAEDQSALRHEIAEVVRRFDGRPITYIENETNLGFDANVRKLVSNSRGKFVVLMGDDDLFIAGSLGVLKQFLQENPEIVFVLRRYVVNHGSEIEDFRYLERTTVLDPSEETVAWLFKRSVVLGGFTINRDLADGFASSELDGTLLYQVFLMARACMLGPSAYLDIPLVMVTQSYRSGQALFGTAEAEQHKYDSGAISERNSINFTRSYFEIAAAIDRMEGSSIVPRVRTELSKYSYPFLSLHRWRGRRRFLQYSRDLASATGLNATWHFYAYVCALVVLDEPTCDALIRQVKRRLGYTPNL